MHNPLTRTATLALVSVVLILIATLPVKAEDIKSTGRFSGSFIAANFDFDHADGSTPASTNTFAGEDSRFGEFTGQSVTEVAADGHTCTPPSGVARTGTEFAAVGHEKVVVRLKGGDLRFFTGTSFTQCIDFTSGTPPFPANFSVADTGTGGTGKFEGSTGTFTAKGTGAILSVDASGARLFGWDQVTYTSTTTLPED
jgi:hypothetical protein